MFEIPDEDEDFWEGLPLDDITNSSTSETGAIGGTKRLSLETDLQTSVKRLRSGTVKSPDLEKTEKSNLIRPRITQAPVSPKKTQVGHHERSEYQHTMRSSHRSQQIEMLSPIHPTSRVPAISLHVVLPVDQEPVSFHTRQQTSRPSVESPLQTPVRVRRKFPGPAGLLPKISPGSIRENSMLSKQTVSTSPEITHQQDDSIILSSQSSEEVFNETAWQTLLQDLGDDGKKMMIKFSIVTSLQKARKKLLPKGKVPLVMAVIETVDWQGSDASVCLKDKSGKIQGTVHQSLMKEHQCEIQPGTVVVLRQVSVISPTARNHYLNITPANVVAIYSNTPDGLKTIRNTEKTKSLNMILQNIESYITEDVRERRRSGVNESRDASSYDKEYHSTASTLNVEARNCELGKNVMNRNHQNVQTPQRLFNSNMQAAEVSNITPRHIGNQNCQIKSNVSMSTPNRPIQQTPQRPQTSNKFKFIKTPTVSNNGSPMVKGDNSVNSYTKNSNWCTNTFGGANGNVPNLPANDNAQRKLVSTAINENKGRNIQGTSVQNTYSGINNNSTDLNANQVDLGRCSKTSPPHVPENNSTERNVGNNQTSIKTFKTSIRTDNYTALRPDTPSETSSPSTKHGFKFKSTSKSSKDNGLPQTHTVNEKMASITGSSTAYFNTGKRNILNQIKEPPRPCVDAESLWQDDLSDDLLSQLSEDMM